MKRKPEPAKNIFSAFIELTKPRITMLNLVSTSLGFYLGGNGIFNFFVFISTIAGTFLLSAGAGAMNHSIERDLDALMDRTKSRPIPAGLIKNDTALYFGFILSSIGLFILFINVNELTAMLGVLTIILYIFVYTPIKKITWLNTTIGAVPGGMPALGGWVAASGTFSADAWILFSILFLWQHPHFYAIALMC